MSVFYENVPFFMKFYDNINQKCLLVENPLAVSLLEHYGEYIYVEEFDHDSAKVDAVYSLEDVIHLLSTAEVDIVLETKTHILFFEANECLNYFNTRSGKSEWVCDINDPIDVRKYLLGKPERLLRFDDVPSEDEFGVITDILRNSIWRSVLYDALHPYFKYPFEIVRYLKDGIIVECAGSDYLFPANIR